MTTCDIGLMIKKLIIEIIEIKHYCSKEKEIPKKLFKD